MRKKFKKVRRLESCEAAFGVEYDVVWKEESPFVNENFQSGGRCGAPRSLAAKGISEFPRARCMLALLSWGLLYWHIWLVNQNCCAVTTLAWQRGTNFGVCGGCRVKIEEGYYTTSCYKVTQSIGSTYCGDSTYCVEAEEYYDGAPYEPDCACCAPIKTAIWTAPVNASRDKVEVDSSEASFYCTFAFFVAAWFLAFDADIRGEQSLVQVTVGLFRNFGPFAILGLGYVIAVCVLGFVFELLLGVYFQHPSLFTVLRDAQNRRGEDARVLEQTTRAACEKKPRLVMYNECSHGVRRGKRTDRVVTHTAEAEFSIDGASEQAIVIDAVKRGGYWEIPNGDRTETADISRSRSGLIELRVSLELVWATEADAHAFETAFEAFCAENNRDSDQRNWVVVHGFETIEQQKLWKLEDGAMPSCLNCWCFLLASLLGLGWLYETWYNSLKTVVELPLHKTLTVVRGDVEAASSSENAPLVSGTVVGVSAPVQGAVVQGTVVASNPSGPIARASY